ncbi:MAG TPA: twin-arginine translocase TatA/TatE family subunit [Candidatus Thermoplasmatota archaeon]|jgi:sec-independent protein translocase protein TatA|nr:twin-arginine translocase TatA/TatE family subunit [Candidatus Thermoplasmatota archaeon]
MLTVLALFQSLGPAEILIILLIVLLLFGSAKIPEMARNLGKAKAEFKRGEREGLQELEREQDEEALKRRARELGISTEGKSLDELRREVAAKGTG